VPFGGARSHDARLGKAQHEVKESMVLEGFDWVSAWHSSLFGCGELLIRIVADFTGATSHT
jgi:hypothetical protein